MKNKIIYLILIFFFYKNILHAQELYSFETKSIEIIENGDVVKAKKGKAISADKNIEILADNFEYSKVSKKLQIYGNAIILINSTNLKVEFDEGIIDQNNFLFQSQQEVKLHDFNNNIKVSSKIINYNKLDNIVESSSKSNITDIFGNRSIVDSFKYELNNSLFKIKNLDFYDKQNNNLKLSIAYLNTKTNNLYGKDVIVNLIDNNLKINRENQPRLRGNSIVNTNSFTEVKKGVFTMCKKTDTCPPWEISAKTILHDKENKVIKYENALLKIYDKPIIYLPKFMHPDPTVERQSGFLAPSIRSSSDQKNFLTLPYYFVLSDNKDATFFPRLYDNEQVLLQTEYRQANYKTNHISDFSFKIDDNKKLKNHFFYNYNKKFNLDNFIENDFNIKIQTTSKDTYIKKNKIRSDLIDNENILENSTRISLSNSEVSTTMETTIFEHLNKNESDRYEYILPKIDFSKKLNNMTKLNGSFTFDSQIMGKHYDTNVLEKTNINDLSFRSIPKISKRGFYNDYKFLLKNANTEAKNSKSLKNQESSYLSGVLQFNSSLPLKKENVKYERLLNPKLSLRIAPNYTKDHSSEYNKIDINNIYSLDRIQKNEFIEGDFSLTYGNEFSISKKENYLELLNFKIANNLRLKENKDLTRSSQLGKKVSSILNEISIKPNNLIGLKYNSSIKNNLHDVNYENLITEFKINNIIGFSFDYFNQNESLEERGSYLTKEAVLNFDGQNKLTFSTRENKNKNLTEYYNLAYQYDNDCLSASIEYNKEFYQDRDIRPNNSLFLKLTIIPTTNKNNYSDLFN